MSVNVFLEEMSVHVDRFVANLHEVHPDDLGLDFRSARMLYVGDDVIAVSKSSDKKLQYYGGFEYVDQDCRVEMGDYVFYKAENSRVKGHIKKYMTNTADQDA